MNPTRQQLAPPISTGRGTRHVSAPSQDTNASGFADSTISNGGESMVLSQFPTPPVSIPTTPIHTDFGPIASGSPIRTMPASPLRVVRRKPLPVPGPLQQKAQSSQASTSSATPASPAQSSASQAKPISPYDWHDGASSIGMDATEDKLLSTSFITNLLQESANKKGRRLSNGSSAISGFSEMTYPPLASTVASRNVASTSRAIVVRPQGGRPPPSSFVPIPESPDPLAMYGDGDSETLYSHRDQPSILRADLSPQPVGMAQAVLRNISPGPSNSLQHVSSSEPLVPPSLPIPRNRKIPSSNYQSRDSVHSTKSAVSSFISKISSHRSVQRVMGWRRAKPLPPVPLIPHIPITAEVQHRREDESKPLPDLVNRAEALHGLLEKGYHPHHSLHSYYAANKDHSQFDDDTILHEATSGTYQSGYESRSTPQPSFSLSRNRDTPISNREAPPNKRKKIILIGVGIAVILAAVAIIVGVVVGKKKSQPSCIGDLVGTSCNLNATCTCTSQQGGRCDPLAQNIVDLVPSLNSFFSLNLTTNQVYNQIWLVQGTTPNSCKQQGILVDVGPNLRSDTQPNVTQWAQATLLWAVVSSQNLAEVAKLQTFVQKAPWGSFSPSSDSFKFATSALGYDFNFASQSVTPIPATFTNVGQPSQDQLSRVNSNAKAALDRMYSFARAGSTLRKTALQVYWANVLKQDPKDLNTFISALTVSPVLLPFDATSVPIAKLLNSTPASFPPPLSCYPGLTKTQADQITRIETDVFNLSKPSNASQFDTGCFADHPVYGILDVLRLRLPSPDLRTGVPRQAAVLKGAVSPRILLRKGVTVSPLPGPSNVTNITSDLSDPRNYGTLGLSSHIILDYLSSIGDPEVATTLVKYVLSSATMQIPPPDNTSTLFTSLSQIPTLEVAVFGSVLPSDIDHVRSAFTTSSGGFFFGTDQGTALRNWVISGCNSATAWAEYIFSPRIVRDSSFLEPVFNQTWTAVSRAISSNVQNVGLFNVTNSFEITGRYSVY